MALVISSLSGALPTTSLVLPQNPAAPATTVIAKVISGDLRIDPLLDSANFRFNDGSNLGTPVTVTFSFPDEAPSSYSDEDIAGWKPFSEAQRATTREMLNLIQKQVNITFQEVTDSSTDFGTMRLSNNIQKDSGGYALLPNSTGTDRDSDTWIAISDDTNLTEGSFNWMTLLHEIGHAIGLNHPGNYNAGEAVNVDAVGNFLGVNEDAFFNSIMSYRWSAQNIYDTWFMPYDMLALRYLYGKNPFNTGNSRYNASDSSGRMAQNIVDDGGTDTLNFSAVTTPLSLDLTPGAYSSFGFASTGVAALANMSISFDAIIENAIGTAQNDSMIGNGADNVLTGGGGSDVIDGGAGTDTAVFSVSRTAATITKSGTGWTASFATDGTDTLTNIERLQFSDVTVALDISGAAGQAYRIYQAAFNRAADAAGLGYWISVMDSGATLNNIAQGFVDSPEFKKLYGTNPTNAQVVAKMYDNVLHRTPDQAGYDYWVGVLDRAEASVAAVLATIGESPENQAALVGVMGNGIVFIPYGG